MFTNHQDAAAVFASIKRHLPNIASKAELKVMCDAMDAAANPFADTHRAAQFIDSLINGPKRRGKP